MSTTEADGSNHTHEAYYRYRRGTRHVEGYLAREEERIKCWCGEVLQEWEAAPLPSEDPSVIMGSLPIVSAGSMFFAECYKCGDIATMNNYSGPVCPDCWDEQEWVDDPPHPVAERGRERIAAMEPELD